MVEDNAQPLGDVIKDLVGNVISERQKQCRQLTDIWQQLLPEELSGHCRLIEFSSGTIRLKVSGPAYLHELRLCKGHLVKELNKCLDGVRVRDIKTEL